MKYLNSWNTYFKKALQMYICPMSMVCAFKFKLPHNLVMDCHLFEYFVLDFHFHLMCVSYFIIHTLIEHMSVYYFAFHDTIIVVKF